VIRLLFFLSFFVASPALGATYYAATNGSDDNPCVNGNSGAPKQHLMGTAGAFKCLASGDTLYIRGGDYPEALTIPANPASGGHIPNGTGESARTIVSAFPGETVRVGGMTLGDGGEFSWMLFANITFNPGFFGESYDGSPGGLYIGQDTHHITFDGCHFINGSRGISGAGHHHIFKNGQVYWNANHGIYWSGSDSIFDKLLVHFNGGHGIQVYETGSSSVSNNVLKNSTWHHNGRESPPTRFGGAGGVLISHGTNNQMYNNVATENFQGLQISDSCINCVIYNNTSYNNLNYGIVVGGGTSGNPYPTGSIVKNNIAANNQLSGIHKYEPNGPLAATITNNLCAQAGDNCDQVGEPAFEDAAAGNFKLRDISPARNTGVDLSSLFNTDINGEARGQGGAWDKGAYEYKESGGSGPPANGNPIYVRKPASGGNDANTCTQAESQGTAKATITNALRECMNVPGKVLYVEAGTYVEEIDTLQTPITGGSGPSFTTATRIEGYGAGPTILQSPPGGNVTLWLRGTDQYLHFKKLTIDGANRTFNTVAIAESAHHIRFEEVEVKNTLGAGLFEGIHVSGANQIELVNVSIRDVQTDAVKLVGTINGFLCQRCHLFGALGKGLNVTSSGAKSNITIQETELRNNGGDGIDLAAGTGTLLQNLLVHSNGGRGVWIQNGTSGTRTYNSTIYGNTGMGLQCDAGATSTELRNNIVTSNTAGNLQNNCSATVAKNFCTAASAACEFFGDPLFVAAPSNLRLGQGSPAIDQGENIPSILVDYAGNARRQGPQGKQDIGAFESPGPQAPSPGVLRVAASNPRYFENTVGEIVYLTGAYSWNFASTMPDSEVTQYLNYAQAHGHNSIRAPSQDYDGSAQSTNYFTVLASRIAQAAALGIYVQVSVFPSLMTTAPFNNQAFNEAYTRSLVQAVGSNTNVLYETGNEMETQALDAGTLGSFVNRIVDVINDEQSLRGFVPRRMVGISDFRATGATYGANPAVVSFLLGSHADFVQIGFSQSHTGVCTIIPDYGGQKVSIPDSDHIKPYNCDYIWVWKMLMNGANPMLLEGNAFFPDHTEPDNPSDTVGAAMTYQARIRMGDTRTYAGKLSLSQAVPHPELTSTGFALAWPGNEYLVYQPGTGSFTVTLTAGTYTVEWFNPTAQVSTTTAPVNIGSTTAVPFSTPLNASNDAVLLLKKSTPPEELIASTESPCNLLQLGWFF
jgi:Right handed beta helix region